MLVSACLKVPPLITGGQAHTHNCEISDEDTTEPTKDIPAEDMPGVIRTDLQKEDNAEMVKDNIDITGVDPREMEDYPKIKFEIDQPPSQPASESNNESVPISEPINAGTIKELTLVAKPVKDTPTTTPIVQGQKESPC